MTKDMLSTIGQPLDGPMNKDAIHIAGKTVQARVRLLPGEKVSFEGDQNGEIVGIVDPFLEKIVEIGQWFWLLLTPRTVTGIRHEWQHPQEIEKSKKWIEEYASYLGTTSQNLIDGANRYLLNGIYLEAMMFQEEDLNLNFWKHYERVTNSVVPEDQKVDFFMCCA